jgi:hypothetical protein
MVDWLVVVVVGGGGGGGGGGNVDDVSAVAENVFCAQLMVTGQLLIYFCEFCM